MKQFSVWLQKWKWFGGIVAVLVLFDQASKFWCVGALTNAFEGFGARLSFGDKLGRFLGTSHPEPTQPVTVLESFWRFHYVENTGAAFSMFVNRGADWMRVSFLLAMAAAAMVAIVVYYRKLAPEQRLSRVALAFVFSGALGNFIDRARLGYVVDFVQWHWHDRAYWPTFNVADAAITVGVSLMLLEMVLVSKAAKRGRATPAKAKGG